MQAIFFDFDGVIVNSVNIKTLAFQKLFQQHGLEIQAQVKKYHIENGGISRHEKIKYYYNNLLMQPIDEDEINCLANQFSKIILDEIISLPLAEGATSFFEKHSKKINLYIISGTPEEELNIIAHKKNIASYFKGIYGSPRKKSNIILDLMSQNSYSKNEVLFIGDAMTDYEAASNCKIPFLGVKSDGVLFPDNTNICDNPFTYLIREIQNDNSIS